MKNILILFCVILSSKNLLSQNINVNLDSSISLYKDTTVFVSYITCSNKGTGEINDICFTSKYELYSLTKKNDFKNSIFYLADVSHPLPDYHTSKIDTLLMKINTVFQNSKIIAVYKKRIQKKDTIYTVRAKKIKIKCFEIASNQELFPFFNSNNVDYKRYKKINRFVIVDILTHSN